MPEMQGPLVMDAQTFLLGASGSELPTRTIAFVGASAILPFMAQDESVIGGNVNGNGAFCVSTISQTYGAATSGTGFKPEVICYVIGTYGTPIQGLNHRLQNGTNYYICTAAGTVNGHLVLRQNPATT